MNPPLRVIAVWIAFSAAAIGPLRAQSTTATLKGLVTEPDGSMLPGVAIHVASATHGSAARTVLSDEEGRYRFQLLPPAGDYFLSVSFPGFAPMELGPIDLDPGKTTVQDITLRASGDLTERIEVSVHGSIVDTESTKSSTTFNTDYIEGLPIIGRSYLDVLTLTPGVTDTDGDGNPNVQGARETGLQYRLDGGNITDPVDGRFGQFLNYDAIEEIEVITAGASAEYGRADGGFANIITKSGGNDFEGSFKLFWRGPILDGDGAGENEDIFIRKLGGMDDFSRRVDLYGTAGGALVKDKLWYFASLQRLDRIDVSNLAGSTIPLTVLGRTSLVKATWQADRDDKISLQVNTDPYKYTGLFLDLGVSRDSDAVYRTGGATPQLRWTTILSPRLLMETLLTHFDTGVSITPVSDLFHEIQITTKVKRIGNTAFLVAQYPDRECSVTNDIRTFIRNCDPSRGPTSIYHVDVIHNTVAGPFPFKLADERLRNSIKTDLTYTLEDAWGEHQIKTGLEFADERFRDRPIVNAYFIDAYEPCRWCAKDPNLPFDAVSGFQLLVVPIPTVLDQASSGFNSSAYVTDTWKPRPNLTFQIGVRLDQEDMDSLGFTPFEPRDEKRRSIKIVEGLCADAERVKHTGQQSNSGFVCNNSLRLPGQPPYGAALIYRMDADTPEWLRKFDRNRDGIFDSGADGDVWNAPFTLYSDRVPEAFTITNRNVSPRLSFAWDPWADGKTKIYSTWGRYYDRLFLDTVAGENSPDFISFVFTPSPASQTFEPSAESQRVSSFSVSQVDRNLSTPYTDVFSFGVERELAPEWSAKVTYTQRLAWDLLQDVDVNHVLCRDYGPEFGIPPETVCATYIDSKGRIHLSDDIFGTVTQLGPNGAPDLYNVSPNFNEILRVGNHNSSHYRSIAAEVQRRLHRNWQMSASYTYSKAYGQAEEFLSGLGDDPTTVDDEEGYLSYDQRHRVILLLVSHLPKDVELGTTITWESGTPFSVIRRIVDRDNVGNASGRTFYPTGQRNDQRNGAFWGLDIKLVRRFTIGGVQASADLAVNNAFNMDDATLSAFLPASGGQLSAGPRGLRRFGRFWELGLGLNF